MHAAHSQDAFEFPSTVKIVPVGILLGEADVVRFKARHFRQNWEKQMTPEIVHFDLMP